MKRLRKIPYITNAMLLIPQLSEVAESAAAFLEFESLRVGVIGGRKREQRSVERSKRRCSEFHARHTARALGDHKTQERCSPAGCAD
jgi:hypothetical protein